MKRAYTDDGRAYIELSDKEAKEIWDRHDGTPIYGVNNKDCIPPPDCEHEFEISDGMPSNIRGCKKCIYWEFTKLPVDYYSK